MNNKGQFTIKSKIHIFPLLFFPYLQCYFFRLDYLEVTCPDKGISAVDLPPSLQYIDGSCIEKTKQRR